MPNPLTSRQIETISALRKGSEALRGDRDFRTRFVNVLAVDVLEVIEATDILQARILELESELVAVKAAAIQPEPQ